MAGGRDNGAATQNMFLFRISGLLSALALFGFAAWLNYQELVAPKKGGESMLGLLMIDALVLLVVAVAVQLFRRHKAEREAVERIIES